MSTFAVIREAGPGWHGGGMYEQPEANDHAAFMNALANSVEPWKVLVGAERLALAQVI